MITYTTRADALAAFTKHYVKAGLCSKGRQHRSEAPCREGLR